MRGRYLASTIVIGVFLLISVLLVVWLIPFILTETLEAYINSLPHSNDGAGGWMGVIPAVFALPVVGAIYQVAYIPAILCLVNSAVSLPFSIRNRKSYSKAISIINYCYIGLFCSIFVFSLVKLFLFIAQIG